MQNKVLQTLNMTLLKYFFGEGVEIDKDSSFYWYKKSAEQGLAKAQYMIALSYNYGDGIDIDLGKSFYWFKKSANQGGANAQFTLGVMYLNGNGVPMNKKTTAYWIKKSYENGYEFAKKYWKKMNYGSIDFCFFIV